MTRFWIRHWLREIEEHSHYYTLSYEGTFSGSFQNSEELVGRQDSEEITWFRGWPLVDSHIERSDHWKEFHHSTASGWGHQT